MYFIVYLLRDGINIIVPKIWIKDFDNHLEKFLNFGLNNSQNYLCFWTECPQAFDDNGQPKLDFAPDHTQPFASHFPETGWHICKIKKCRADYNEALFYKEFQRTKIAPKIYNEKRLLEKPIPNIPDLDRILMPPPNTPNTPKRIRKSDKINRRRHSIAVAAPFSTSISAPIASTSSSTSNDNFVPTAMVTVAAPFSTSISAPLASTSSSTSNDNSVATAMMLRQTQSQVQDNPNQNLSQNNSQYVSIQSLPTDLVHDLAVASENVCINQEFDSHTEQQADNDLDYNQSGIQISANLCLALVPYGSIPISQPIHLNDVEINVDMDVESNVYVNAEQAEAETQHMLVKAETHPLYEISHENAEEIDDLLEGVTEKVSEDVIMSYTHFPKPLKSTTDNLIKVENDDFSGKIPFGLRRNGRVYKIGDKMYEIPLKVIENFRTFNTLFPESELFDEKVVRALLLVLVDKNKLAKCDIEEGILKFIQDILIHRTNAAPNRVSNLPRFVAKFCEEKKIEKIAEMK